MTDEDIAIETTETSLTIRRTFDAPRERVFRAFTDPDELAKWYAPGDMTAEIHQVDPEIGGRLSVSMVDQDETHDAEGIYSEVVEHERLVHTWQWTHHDDPYETIITVEFADVDGGTEVVLTHENHPTSDSVENHAQGWAGTFDNLEAILG